MLQNDLTIVEKREMSKPVELPKRASVHFSSTDLPPLEQPNTPKPPPPPPPPMLPPPNSAAAKTLLTAISAATRQPANGFSEDEHPHAGAINGSSALSADLLTQIRKGTKLSEVQRDSMNMASSASPAGTTGETDIAGAIARAIMARRQTSGMAADDRQFDDGDDSGPFAKMGSHVIDAASCHLIILASWLMGL